MSAEPCDPIDAAAERLRSEDPAEVAAAEATLLAAMADDPRARPLAAAAYDRRRMLRGQRQKFGTQCVEREGGRELWPVDPSTTDSERAKWGLPPLAELRRRAADPD